MVVAFAPGRVNLVGEHTDYNEGLALPFAIDRGVTVTARALPSSTIEAEALDLGETDSFAVHAVEPATGWRAFVRGTVAEMVEAGHRVTGARLTITGSVPRGAGLSSSAALEVALCLALLTLSGEGVHDRRAVARLCSRVENRWVGARTGLLDQLAVLLGADGVALRIDFRSLEVRHVTLALDGWTLVTAPSGEEHGAAASGYNARRDECAQACRLLGIESLRSATEADVDRLPAPLTGRLRHVLDENLRVEMMVAALQDGNPSAVGALLTASHASLRDCYDVSTPAVEAAVARLSRAGAAGARTVGGGFGGQVLAIFPPGVTPPADATAVSARPGARVHSE
jgi:galactokinase